MLALLSRLVTVYPAGGDAEILDFRLLSLLGGAGASGMVAKSRVREVTESRGELPAYRSGLVLLLAIDVILCLRLIGA